ncbi:MAG: hypothetical protein GX490_08175 [Bacilli bacterium]|nr:hypothetical protein [Bacilli bacterium]
MGKIYDEGELIYIGITSDPKARERADKRKYGQQIRIEYIVNDTSLSKARVIETGLIAYHGLENLKNDRLSISTLRYATDRLLNKIDSEISLLVGR